DAINAKGFFGHFDRLTKRPTDVLTAPFITATTPGGMQTATSSPPDLAKLTKELAAIMSWDKNKKLGKSLLTQKIFNLALMKVCNMVTIKEC
ncbi:hypothetical protein C0991_004978, partial [Blastosporella zonata]